MEPAVPTLTKVAAAPSFLWPDTPLKVGIVTVLGVAVALMVAKPRIMFESDGQFKHFGPRKNETLLPFWLALVAAGLVAYYVTLARA